MHPTIPLIRLLLAAYWALATTAILMKTFFPIFRVSLTYGKLHNTATNAPVSRSFPFAKYATLPISAPAFAWRAFYLCGMATWSACQYLKGTNTCLSEWLFCFQLLRRFLECVFVHRFSSARRVPLLQLAAGLSFYVAAPVTLMVASYQQCGVVSQWTRNSVRYVNSFA